MRFKSLEIVAKLVLAAAMLWGVLIVAGFSVHWGLGLVFLALAVALIVWI